MKGLSSYSENDFYSHGENVEQATRDILEDFRQRKHPEARNESEIAVEMLNEGLERWEQDRRTERALA